MQDVKEDEMGKGDERSPVLQVIVLGSGGGPLEDNTTSMLVRSLAEGWKRGSILGVDGGVHLGAIAKILKRHKSEYSDESIKLPATLASGPFAGLELPYRTPKANAAHITRKLINTCLLTHPHLDHINGFVVNTASLPGSRPKHIAGLPSTIEAIKSHIFNNIIWPNLSDENNGAGLVTYMRLTDGGSPVLGDEGYVEICDGLSVKTRSVSHGVCFENHSHRGTSDSVLRSPSQTISSPRLRTRANSQNPPRTESRAPSNTSGDSNQTNSNNSVACVYDSSAWFIRDIASGSEVLIFGDIEADTISLSPRNKLIWMDAAPKVASGALRGIFIECSYDDSQTDDTLFGHLAPRYLIEELQVLARYVEEVRIGGHFSPAKKRKRGSLVSYSRSPAKHQQFTMGEEPESIGSHSQRHASSNSNIERKVSIPSSGDGRAERNGHGNGIPIREREALRPLTGLKLVIIHMKDKLDDEPHVGERILDQLLEYEKEAQLGCQFVISYKGMSVHL